MYLSEHRGRIQEQDRQAGPKVWKEDNSAHVASQDRKRHAKSTASPAGKASMRSWEIGAICAAVSAVATAAFQTRISRGSREHVRLRI